MIEQLAKTLVELKKDLAKIYDGKSQVQEIIPKSTSDDFSIPQPDLELLHQFATKNPIYYNSYELQVNDVDCIVYEGDINKYWLNSIQHGSSNAPFSPTWIMSAYIGALFAKELGYREVIDVGSGDGRIAFCAKVLGLESYSIEIDDMLVELQKPLTFLDFHPYCADAIAFGNPLIVEWTIEYLHRPMVAGEDIQLTPLLFRPGLVERIEQVGRCVCRFGARRGKGIEIVADESANR